ncbi:maleylpyruvate isomerase family mycothiol-dependent enzyme [Nocardia huaxiensis]|uniref:maleylpyruvate isomerase family mycothiol-dependent enzyme n=1 Tax=Nocardia huaxiensis TaxID=2755382 RepID=UPI001E2A2A6A|nr:maleylpyruvate isomerase family mycothiol-dependent enzyme [Nocardia huaxiensis]UFS96497.1 maleylpyruvate isomerase family mycothiol-dependent enzyme [Nocardia huaxiensis]
MDAEDCWKVIEQQRLAIADMLADISAEEWQLPSLCTGWRVRDVATHVALVPGDLPMSIMVGTAVRARGNYNRMIDILVRRFADAPGFDPVATLRRDAASRKLPKLTNYRNIHFDTMVHAQDMAIPLGRSITVSPEAASVAATRAAEVGWPVWDKHRLDGLHLVATDSTWEHGAGAEIRGPILALLLLITGRPVALERVDGPGVDIMAARMRAPEPSAGTH